MADTVVFHIAVLTIATLAFYLFIFLLPKQPRKHQHKALICFQYAFVLSFVAFVGYTLRYLQWQALSVGMVNLFLLAAFYLFYQGVRLRFNASLNRRGGLLVVLHLLLFPALALWLWYAGDTGHLRDISAFVNHSVPLLLAQRFLFVRRQAHNGGDRLIQLTLLMIWMLVLIAMPFYDLMVNPVGGIFPVVTLLALTLECLLFAGVAMSYIHDLFDKLKEQAYTDNLTGLKNRRFFKRIVASVFSSASRYQFNVCVILADIDDFKKLNDEFGHSEGDQAIKAVAQVFKETVRTEDVLVRFGGEEFLVLAPNTSMEMATLMAQRMRAQVAERCVSKSVRTITLSIGVSQVYSLEDLEAAIVRADSAMYQAKKLGKNRVEIAQISEQQIVNKPLLQPSR